VIWVGLLQTAGNTALSLWALRQGPAGRSALLCYTMPFWVVLLAWPTLSERPTQLQALALVAAGTGLALVFTGGAGTSSGWRPTAAISRPGAFPRRGA
jgi:drug/metabolite transporter (DMT)-like permease